MKNVKLFSMALAALMLGACSSDEVAVNGGQEGTVAGGEKGYVNVAINLPTQPSSRANDVYDDGENYEYNVKDARLLLFTGTTEADAVYQSSYVIGTDFATENPADDNITSKLQKTVQITRPTTTAGQNIYAYVVLNGVSSGVVAESNNAITTIGGVTVTAGQTKFTDIAYAAMNLDVSKIASTTDGGCFLMSNAPLFTAQGGTTQPTGGAVTVLSEIDPNNIYSTSTEAQENPAASIYVERAVAKVTVNGTQTPSEGSLAYTLNGWTLDITNKKSYLVRNTTTAAWWQLKAETSNDYRFVGSVPVASGLYRTYWATDPNYDGTNYTDATTGNVNVATEFNTIVGTAPTTGLLASGADAYCLENTFDIDNMNKDQTTRVVVAAKLTGMDGQADNGDFYVLNEQKGTLYNAENVVKTIKAAYLAQVYDALHAVDGLDLQAGENFGEDDIVVTFANDDATNSDIAALGGGNITVSDIHVSAESADKFVNDQIPASLASNNATVTASINGANKISFYKGGVAYYYIRTRHFDDSQASWSEEGKTESYPTANAAQNWLGRWGALRNNWYEVNITGIRSIGDAEVEPEYGSDDPVEEWISYEINVLSWAKRTQSVEL